MRRFAFVDRCLVAAMIFGVAGIAYTADIPDSICVTLPNDPRPKCNEMGDIYCQALAICQGDCVKGTNTSDLPPKACAPKEGKKCTEVGIATPCGEKRTGVCTQGSGECVCFGGIPDDPPVNLNVKMCQ